jgi:hypothetical protein
MMGITVIVILIGWFFAARWLARRVTNRIADGWKKTLVIWVLMPVLFLLPLTDEIVGEVYMKKVLCGDEQNLVFISSIESVKRAKRVYLPTEKIWRGVFISKYQTNYVDLDNGNVFAYSKSYGMQGGLLMRNSLYLLGGGSVNCDRWTTESRSYSGPNETNIKLEQLLDAGETK